VRPGYGSDNPNQTWLNTSRDGVVVNRRQGNTGPEVQVFYTDRNLLSDWLPINNHGSAGAIFYHCPRIGDAVTVDHLGTGIEQGTVVASHPSGNNPSMIPNSLDSVALSTDDGAFFEHEPQSGTTTLAGVGSLHLHVNGETLAFSGTWTLNASGNVKITAPQISLNGVLIDQSGNVTLPAGMTVKADKFAGASGTPVANPRMTNSDGSGNGS
jgi:phage baseplate assembly protein gpV